MSLPALPAFSDDSMRRSDELAAILVIRRARPRRRASDPSLRLVRDERRTCAPATPPAHTRGHIAYGGLAHLDGPSIAQRATLLGWRPSDGRHVLAAPRGWKNDFR